MVLGEEGVVVVLAVALVVAVPELVVDVPEPVVVVTPGPAFEAFVDVDWRATTPTLARRTITTATDHNHHFL